MTVWGSSGSTLGKITSHSYSTPAGGGGRKLWKSGAGGTRHPLHRCVCLGVVRPPAPGYITSNAFSSTGRMTTPGGGGGTGAEGMSYPKVIMPCFAAHSCNTGFIVSVCLCLLLSLVANSSRYCSGGCAVVFGAGSQQHS